MAYEEHDNMQPLRELEWLTKYFKKHCREDLAGAISRELKDLRMRAQDALTENEASDVIDFKPNSKRLSSEQINEHR